MSTSASKRPAVSLPLTALILAGCQMACVVGPKYTPPSIGSRGLPRASARRFPEHRRLAQRRTERRCDSRELVGTLRGSAAQRARRTGERLEPEHRRRRRRLYRRASGSEGGAVAVLPNGLGWREHHQPAPCGSHLSRRSDRQHLHGIHAAARGRLGARPLGTRAKYRAGQRFFRAGERRRS